MPLPPRRPAHRKPGPSGASEELRRARSALEDLEAKARAARAQITCMELERFAREHPGVEGFSVSASWESDHEGEQRMMLWANVDFDPSSDESDGHSLYAIKEEVEAILAPWGSQLLGRRFDPRGARDEIGRELMGQEAFDRWMSRR